MTWISPDPHLFLNLLPPLLNLSTNVLTLPPPPHPPYPTWTVQMSLQYMNNPLIPLLNSILKTNVLTLHEWQLLAAAVSLHPLIMT